MLVAVSERRGCNFGMGELSIACKFDCHSWPPTSVGSGKVLLLDEFDETLDRDGTLLLFSLPALEGMLETEAMLRRDAIDRPVPPPSDPLPLTIPPSFDGRGRPLPFETIGVDSFSTKESESFILEHEKTTNLGLEEQQQLEALAFAWRLV